MAEDKRQKTVVVRQRTIHTDASAADVISRLDRLANLMEKTSEDTYDLIFEQDGSSGMRIGIRIVDRGADGTDVNMLGVMSVDGAAPTRTQRAYYARILDVQMWAWDHFLGKTFDKLPSSASPDHSTADLD